MPVIIKDDGTFTVNGRRPVMAKTIVRNGIEWTRTKKQDACYYYNDIHDAYKNPSYLKRKTWHEWEMFLEEHNIKNYGIQSFNSMYYTITGNFANGTKIYGFKITYANKYIWEV